MKESASVEVRKRPERRKETQERGESVRAIEGVNEALGSTADLRGRISDFLKKEAKTGDQAEMKKAREAVAESKSVSRRVGRGLRRLLIGVTLAGALGGAANEARHFLSDEERPADGAAEPASSKDIAEARKALAGTLAKTEREVPPSPEDPWPSLDGLDPFSPEGQAAIQRLNDERAEEYKKEAEAKRRKSEEENQKREEEYKEYRRHVDLNTKDMANRLLSAMRDTSSGKSLRDILDQYRETHKERNEYVDSFEVNKMIEEDAKRLEEVDPKAAGKLYEFLGDDDYLQYGLRHGDSEIVYDQTAERLAATAGAELDDVYPDGMFTDNAKDDALYDSIASLGADQQKAVAVLLRDSIENMHKRQEALNADVAEGHVGKGTGAVLDALDQGVTNMEALLARLNQ